MKSIKNILMPAILLVSSLGYAQKTGVSSEEAAIRATIMDYIEGTGNGEPDKLRRAFHPDFNLYTVNDQDDLWIRSGEKYISNVAPGKKANRVGRIISIDYEGNTATAKAEIVVPGWRVFTDYFLLLKYQGSWKIVQKSYSSRQYLNEDKIATLNSELDTIFSEVNRSDHPAVTALAIYKGEIVYKKAFGSIDLDHKIPATVNTKFQLAALSRQFTAYAILLLEEKNKLSLQDDIRKYLPNLPKYEAEITIDHLLSMTSGLSDFWPMSDLIGLHEEDVLTQNQVLNTVYKIQPAFKPGDDYIYGHTDQVLLAEIIAKVSGKSFASFMKDELFEPLEMNDTEVKDVHNTLVNNVAESYISNEEGFRSSRINFGVHGPINIYSSVDDLAKWELNLLNPRVGTTALIEKFFTSARLNNNETLDSWYGQFTYGQQFYHWGHGVKEIYQTGILGGHASAIFKFPDQEFTVVILSSGMAYSGYLGMELVEHFIGDTFSDGVGSSDINRLGKKTPSKKKLQRFTGTYWNKRSGFSRKLEVQDDTLRYVRSGGRISALLPVSGNKFLMEGQSDVFITFKEKDEDFTLEFESATLPVDLFKRIEKVDYTTQELQSFVGSYYCEMHNIVYNLSIKNDQLIAFHPRVGEVILTPVVKNRFESTSWFFGGIHFNDDLSGFSINTGEIRRLEFKRISS
ncbi:MAG: serine hydrolase [Bacteroidota bacterium]